MRTTLTIEESLFGELKLYAAKVQRPFKAIVNETLRKGLQKEAQAKVKPYQLKTVNMGAWIAPQPMDKALQCADEWGDRAILSKMQK